MQCLKCGAVFEYPPAMWGAREIFVPKYCDPCIAVLRSAEEEEARRDQLGARREAWRDMCPPAYRDTDKGHPGLSQDIVEGLRKWKPESGKSLGLIGATGKGKTRLSFARLKELHMTGWHVFFVSAKKLERMVHWKFSNDPTENSEAQSVNQQVRTCQVLLLDDLGKEKFTERVAGEVYDLIEYRTSSELPIIWTANVAGTILRQRLGDEHGEATVRRLLEFSEVIKA